ncbi:MipA/OmpV family protein [Chitinibacter sp. FCG-7]|uniref:MipA/OmpV family protein n=1 Tax=Chitinibacter mangrovi TaxID=3153927 RepID=A0AAU7FCQ5_9NEIS
MLKPLILSVCILSPISFASELTLGSGTEQGLSRLQSLWAEASEGDNWQLAAGLGVAYAPEVLGGKKYKASPMASLEVAHRSGFFISSSNGIGWSYTDNPAWQAAVFLGQSASRDEKDKLTDKITFKGMGKISSALQAGASVNYTLGDVELSSVITTGLSEKNRGVQLTLGADYTAYASEQFALTLNSALTASNGKYQQRWYGVTAQQAKNSRFKAYQAGSGLTLASVGITGIVPINKELRLISNVTYNQLLGDAADSPLVKSKGSGAFSTYLQYTW